MKRYYILYRHQTGFNYEDNLYYETVILHETEESAIDEFLEFMLRKVASGRENFIPELYKNDQKKVITNIFCK